MDITLGRSTPGIPLRENDLAHYDFELRRLNRTYAADRPDLFSDEGRDLLRRIFVKAQAASWSTGDTEIVYPGAVQVNYRDDDFLLDLIAAMKDVSDARTTVRCLFRADRALLVKVLTAPAVAAMLVEWNAGKVLNGTLVDALPGFDPAVRQALTEALAEHTAFVAEADESEQVVDESVSQMSPG